MKYVLVILLLLMVLCCVGCNNNKTIIETKTTKVSKTEYSIKDTTPTFQTKHVVDINNIEIKKRMAQVYENYFNNKSKIVAIKANSFSILKKDIVCRQKLYEIMGYDAKDAQQMAIDTIIESEIDFQQSLKCKIKISEKELASYIKEQISMAKKNQNNKSYLNYLRNISIEEVYRHEKNNIKKELAVDKYYNYLTEKYGEENLNTEHRKVVEKVKKTENIQILIRP